MVLLISWNNQKINPDRVIKITKFMSYYYSKYGRNRPGKSKWKKVILTFLLLLILVAAGAGYFLYTIIFSPNVWVKKGEISIYIPTDATYEMVLDSLYNKGIIVHRKNFEWLAQHKSFPELVKPGHYIIHDGLNNNELINQLRAGLQILLMLPLTM